MVEVAPQDANAVASRAAMGAGKGNMAQCSGCPVNVPCEDDGLVEEAVSAQAAKRVVLGPGDVQDHAGVEQAAITDGPTLGSMWDEFFHEKFFPHKHQVVHGNSANDAFGHVDASLCSRRLGTLRPRTGGAASPGVGAPVPVVSEARASVRTPRLRVACRRLT